MNCGHVTKHCKLLGTRDQAVSAYFLKNNVPTQILINCRVGTLALSSILASKKQVPTVLLTKQNKSLVPRSPNLSLNM